MKARELLQKGESAIVIFTDGIHFRRKPNGTGWTGHWVINPRRKVNTVIIYRRDRTTQTNQIYIADETSLKRRPDGRHTIALANMREVGSTDQDWLDFAGGSRNPIQYLK